MDITIKTVLNILLYSEIIAAIFATVFYKKYKNTPAKYLLIILWLIVFTEQLGGIMANQRIWLYQNKYSYWLFNIMFPLWKLLYLFIFFKILENQRLKIWVKRFIITYTVAVIINWVFLENFLTDLESYSRIVGSLLITVSSIFYLIELMRSDKIIIFHKKLLFWISIGLMIFYSSSIPFIIMRSFYSKLEYIHNIFIINYVLATIMYLLFTFGFIWSKKE